MRRKRRRRASWVVVEEEEEAVRTMAGDVEVEEEGKWRLG